MLDWHSCQICYPLEIKILSYYYHVHDEALNGVSRLQ